jgi:hypothetical protein
MAAMKSAKKREAKGKMAASSKMDKDAKMAAVKMPKGKMKKGC